MKYFSSLFHAVTTQKAPSQICSFDAKAGWGQSDSPLRMLSGSQSGTQEELLGEVMKTHQPFWDSCECCCCDGLILFRPSDVSRKEWLASINGRGASQLVLLSDFGSAMEFMRLYAPSLMSIPDYHRVPDLLEEMLNCLSKLEVSKQTNNTPRRCASRRHSSISARSAHWPISSYFRLRDPRKVGGPS